ncbi:DNA methyltransferase yeeA [Hypericibacter adhaerens]|uniref:site-specific DNA-methyltransferase (adenine-specific) n=1 Tax=Hypericibacter adhaerens TaxID=2602016 RepID=A0A5J6N083_9PROT|nr:class I SAM-dependent DNA methyltransferase [Hypericibacter adhaerens]QEX20296.1 DNA methyltransferase yeeA [Hypericibacter adhaerens]
MTPEAFIAKWKASSLKESAGAQEHFIDLCRLLGEPTPAEADPSGESYAFEAGATKTTGKEGWADVWKRGCFAWEYKGKGRDLQQAYAQLQQYAVALENPPLLVVSDMARILVHTNWTNTIKQTTEIKLEDLRNARFREVLKSVFSDPERLKPSKTRQSVTEDAAREFADLARRLREQGHEPQRVAHFVNRLVFCMFAEDEGLLPKEMFSRMLAHAKEDPAEFRTLAHDLFAAMRQGGRVGFEKVAWFNGGLFDDDEALPLDRPAIDMCLRAAGLDWSEIDPSIFGTLFERGLDPDKRSQLGAHYTDRDKIMMIVEPVVVRPLAREWEAVREKLRAVLGKETKGKGPGTRARNDAEKLRLQFLERLRAFRVLDPACGSGNFLYLALHALKDLEHRVNIECEALGLPRQFPAVGPEAVHGIEINPYAAELARATVWIGELQWMRRNGFAVSGEPILRPLDTIECRDAVLNPDGSEAAWPKADAIIGNPPFLGDRLHLRTLGDEYVSRLRAAYLGRVPARADFVVYWFEKARQMLEERQIMRFGLVGTKSIAKGASREPLIKIVQSKVCQIFEAWTNEPWVVEGAAVRVAIVCASNDVADWQGARWLNGKKVNAIGADLAAPIGTTGVSLVNALRLAENSEVAFQGVKLTGSFDLTGDEARKMLEEPLNPNSRPNSDVVRRLWDINDVLGRPSDRWVIDFGVDMPKARAQLYEQPFRRIESIIPEQRKKVREQRVRDNYWLFQRPRGKLRKAIAHLRRFIVTPESSEHRIFVWADPSIVIVGSTYAIAREDDVSFGILHSRLHEIWATAQGNRLGAGNQRRYNITVTFETFPFPDGLTPNIPAARHANDPRAIAIAEAAAELDRLRQAWLNPPDLVERVPEVVPGFSDRILPKDAKAAAILKKRTLTNLYNERPAWLAQAHAALDAAVAAAYGWPADIGEEEALERLFALNQARAGAA